jgi:hypothetical protein
MNCISESFKVSSSDNSPSCPHTSQITYVSSESGELQNYSILCAMKKLRISAGSAFLESGWFVKDMGIASFISLPILPIGQIRKMALHPGIRGPWMTRRPVLAAVAFTVASVCIIIGSSKTKRVTLEKRHPVSGLSAAFLPELENPVYARCSKKVIRF